MEFNKNNILSLGLNWNFLWMEDGPLKEVIKILEPHPWRLVGGCVRDSLLNKNTYDIDINTPLEPLFVENLFKNFTINTIGRDHGTVMIFNHPYKIEITTLRKDLITDGRHAQVGFTDSWEEDSNRRDFTINGLMMDYKNQIIYDYHGGISDLIQGKVKFIGNFHDRITEDYLRILRFIRFAIRFNTNFWEQLRDMKSLVGGLKKVSSERIINEIAIIMDHHRWQEGIKAIKFLEIDKIIGGNFNDNFPMMDYDSIEEKWASVLLIYDNPLNKWSLNGHLKKILIKSNHDYNQWNPKILFDVYTNELFNFKIMKIKNKILYGSNQEKFFIKLENFLENPSLKNQYMIKKNAIINENEGPLIREKIIDYLWDLWSLREI
jgi:tRNA nucleotidyltransferase/poly(A) polymerase